MTDNDKTEFMAPLFVTSRNCEVVVGRPWRAMLEFAERHNIEILSTGPHVRMIPAEQLIVAIRAEAAAHAPPPLNEEQEAAAMIRNLGYQALP